MSDSAATPNCERLELLARNQHEIDRQYLAREIRWDEYLDASLWITDERWRIRMRREAPKDTP